MNEDPNTPHLPTFDQNAMETLRPYLLDPREDYPEPYFMLEFNGVPFSTLGGIQAISGQKKNGKSFVLTQLMAAILGHDTERVRQYLPGLTVPQRTIDHLGHLPRVLYVDTEMEKLNSAKVLRRVHWLCGWDMNEPNDRLNVLWLRNVEDEKDDKGNVKTAAHAKRLRLIKLAIEILSPDCVFIDGIRDIIGDFNNNEQSAALVGELMAFATRRNICIWNALHLNPRPGNDDESKMRGHLGTELGNKVSDTLASFKKKTPNGVTFTVKQVDARGKDMDDWTFEVTDDAGNLGIPRITGGGKSISIEQEPQADSEEDIIAWINRATQTYNFPMTRRDVKTKVFGEIGGQKNSTRQQADLTVAINRGYLIETAIKSKGYPMLDVAGDLPF
jgi:hypothetical protein